MDDQSPAPTQPDPGPDHGPSEYWCYHCEKRVAVETLADLPDVVCSDCKNGFVEAVSAAAASASPTSGAVPDPIDDPNFGNQFIQVLRLIAQAAREDDVPPPSPPSDPSDGDYLRIELDGWGNENNGDDDDEDEDGEDEEEEEHSVEVVHEEETANRDRERVNGSDGEEDEIEVIEDDGGEEDDDEMRRRRRDVLRLRLRDFSSRAATRRNRILDWAEILMGLEDHSIELRLQVPDSDTYIGNPGDYVDAAEYEALLQNLAESDSGGRRGAPPTAKAAVEALESVLIEDEESTIACAICKDIVNVGEVAKNLPCGHGYHCDCIVPWLGSRNTCPVCRYELPTDDLEYEEERKRRAAAGVKPPAAASGSSSSGNGGNDASGLE